MAKKRKKQKTRQRDYNKITSKKLLSTKYVLIKDRPPVRKPKKQKIIINDRRLWAPILSSNVLMDDGRPVSYKLSNTKIRDATTAKIAFDRPEKVMVCKRRKMRKQVLFAKRKAGHGRKSSKIRRYTKDSNIKC